MTRLRILSFVLIAAALACALPEAQAKPQQGKGQPAEMQLQGGKAADEAAVKMEKAEMQKQEQMRAMEKQRAKKAEQVQKEAGKGSEKGQAMREEHRRKWWKFWGGDETPETVE